MPIPATVIGLIPKSEPIRLAFSSGGAFDWNLKIIKLIHGDAVKADKGKIISIILREADALSSINTTSLSDLLYSAFQVLGDISRQWQIAVDIITSKLIIGFKPLMEKKVITEDQENIDNKIYRAKLLFVKQNASLDDKMEAIRTLGDVLEYFKKDGIQLANKDDNDLFQILNRFSIRHHNKSQQGDYDKEIFYPWIFYVLLASIYALLELKKR